MVRWGVITQAHALLRSYWQFIAAEGESFSLLLCVCSGRLPTRYGQPHNCAHMGSANCIRWVIKGEAEDDDMILGRGCAERLGGCWEKYGVDMFHCICV